MWPRVSQRKVLVIDDDLDLRDVLSDLLIDDGFEPICVDSGREALRYLRDGEPPSLILLDLMMPDMSGWEFRRAQLSDPVLAGIPVVVMTASRGPPPIPAHAVVYKPVRLRHLLDVVHRAAGPDAS
jgi:two-component system response regulator MprA